MKSLKILTLHLKAEWYNLISSGIKTEDYRVIKSYWTKRLVGKAYDAVSVVYGYTNRRMLFEYLGYHIGKANPTMVRHKPEWLKDDYYCIKLGNLIEF